ncbi:MAG TPA: heparinase II/III family protein [Ignavibacteria bacterium]|nr:heparinase II/III family protein [Ignavibacteria bacterium]
MNIVNRAVNKVNVILNNNIDHLKTVFGSSYKNYNETVSASYVDINLLSVERLNSNITSILIENYLTHKFDILGSGWVDVNHSAEHQTLFRNNLADIEQNILPEFSDEYKFINWHKDFKSGYEWDSKVFCKKIKIGKQQGVDIKIPWELARLHHLVQLAVFSIKKTKFTNQCITEFQNQISDFYINNPAGYGVNWTCAMDVGIRAANMAIAYDLFNQLDTENLFTESFKVMFYNCLFEHCKFVSNNLEYSDKLTTNHYLANIAGLLIASLYLKENAETNHWIYFSVTEIISEFDKQFYNDGGNFESSSSYHRLSLEMVIYSVGYITAFYNIDKKRFTRIFDDKSFNDINNFLGNNFIEKLGKAINFLNDLIKPDGNIAQIGDNDSGRFVKLTPSGNILNDIELKEYLNLIDKKFDSRNYFNENNLECRNTLSSAFGLIAIEELSEYKNLYPLEYSFIKSLTGENIIKSKSVDYKNAESITTELKINFDNYFSKETVIKNSGNLSLKDGLEFRFYPESGIVVYKSDALHMIVYSTTPGQNGIGGHTHLDKGSIELFLNGKEIFSDPGSYLYTSNLEMRNKFRAMEAHNGIIIKDENIMSKLRNSLKINPFMLNLKYAVEFIEVNSSHLFLKIKYEYFEHMREIIINDDSIIVKDFCSVDFEQNFNKFEYFSDGYGKLKKTKA